MAMYAGSGIGTKKTASRLKKLVKKPKKAASYSIGGGTSSLKTNAAKAKAKTPAVKKTTPTTTAPDQQLPTYKDYLADYQAAYQPTINREGQRAASQMASRGLTYSTAGADYEQSVRNALLAEANKQALSVSEQARQADTQAAVDMYGMNLGYEQGMALGFEDKGFTFSPITQRWVNRYLTPNASTTSTANRLISQANVGDPLEDDIMANAPRSAVTSGATGTREVADVKGARMLREYQLEKERLAIERQLAAQEMALKREQLALDRERFSAEKSATEAGTDPYQTALAQYYSEVGGGTNAAESVYTLMTGSDLVSEARAGNVKALAVLRNIRPQLWLEITTGKKPTVDTGDNEKSWLQKLLAGRGTMKTLSDPNARISGSVLGNALRSRGGTINDPSMLNNKWEGAPLYNYMDPYREGTTTPYFTYLLNGAPGGMEAFNLQQRRNR